VRNEKDRSEAACCRNCVANAGRCCPEVSDVDDITEDEIEQEMIIEAINAVLDRLSKQLQNKSVIR
jgi:hypothetical protein